MSAPLFLLTDAGRLNADRIVLVADSPRRDRDYLVWFEWGRLPCETFATARDLSAFLTALKRERTQAVH